MHQRQATTSSRLVLATALAPMAWGTTYAVTTELLPPGRPLLAATLRALPAGLALVAITRRRPPAGWWGRIAVLGTLNIGAFFALLFVAADRLPGGVAATLGAIQPLLVAGLGALVLGERVQRRSLVAGAMGIAGVALLVLRSSAALDPWGVAAGLGGTATMASGVVLTKRWGRAMPLLASTGWQLVAGGLVLIPLMLVVEGPPPALTPTNLAGHLWLAVVGTGLAYTLWFRGVEGLPVQRVSLLGLLSPLVATAVGCLALHQSLAAGQAVGALLVLGGLRVGQGRLRSAGRTGATPPVVRPIPINHQPKETTMSTTTPTTKTRFEPTEIAAETFLVHDHQGEGTDPVSVPLNTMVIRGAEPVVVDTGMAENREQYLTDVFSLVEPEDIRWVFISHDDVDHTGNVNALMSAAPHATLVIDWFMQERMGASLDVSPLRWRWVQDGDALDVGDRKLQVVRPPVFDSPTTRGLFDPTTGVYWGSDSFASPMPTPVRDVVELELVPWLEGIHTFAKYISPWLELVDQDRFLRTVDRIEALQPRVVAGCHTPVIGASRIADALAATRIAPSATVPPQPDQSVLDAIQAAFSTAA